MTEGIIVGVLSLIGTLAGTYFANRKKFRPYCLPPGTSGKEGRQTQFRRGTNLQTGRTGGRF